MALLRKANSKKENTSYPNSRFFEIIYRVYFKPVTITRNRFFFVLNLPLFAFFQAERLRVVVNREKLSRRSELATMFTLTARVRFEYS